MATIVPPFEVIVVAGRHTIQVTQHVVADHERHLELLIDRASRGELVLPDYDTPRIAVGISDIAIWGGMRVYVASLTAITLIQMEQDEDVHTVYLLARHWILVRELSVILVDMRTTEVVARYEHDEVLLWSWWSDEQLIVEDLQGRRIKFGFTSTTLMFEFQPAQ